MNFLRDITIIPAADVYKIFWESSTNCLFWLVACSQLVSSGNEKYTKYIFVNL